MHAVVVFSLCLLLPGGKWRWAQDLPDALAPCVSPPAWLLLQVLARDVAYDLIPFAQRRGLHARLADALETSLPRASPTTIAFHYSKSCHAVEAAEWKRAVKAIQFWEMAAEEAMEGIDHHQVSLLRLLPHGSGLLTYLVLSFLLRV